jgi:hypothetical protein
LQQDGKRNRLLERQFVSQRVWLLHEMSEQIVRPRPNETVFILLYWS